MKKKILVIEDDNFISSLMVGALNRAGYDVKRVTDAVEGVEYLSNEIPDIILLDLILPGMNGFEFLEKIKKEQRTKEIPVVILSNVASREDIAKGFQLGAHSYLVKADILMDYLIKKIKEII